MSYASSGLDFLGGGMEGAGQGAMITAGLHAAGMATGPYAIPLIAGMAGAGALTHFLGGLADKPADEMNMRLGSQQIQMNDLQIAAQKRQSDQERVALRKNRVLQDALSSVFGKYQTLSKGGTP
jgi:hypothetical protein